MKNSYISYSKQSIDNKDVKEVSKVLRSSYLTQGPKIAEFERKLAQITKAKYVSAVNSGTAALHAACFSIEIKTGNEVIVPPLTFVASSNCVLYLGGRPIFADVDQHGLLNPERVEKLINRETKAIITVDYAGQPSYLKELKEICAKYNLYLIEDAAHSLGAFYYNKPIGSIADLTCFSFHPVKSITTGEGGAITTNNKKLYERILPFRTHGITKEKNQLKNKGVGLWYYEMQFLGYNYRLTDIQAALGISQLQKLNKFIKCRQRIANYYHQAFKDLETKRLVSLPKNPPFVKHAWHLYPLRVNFEKIKYSKQDLFNLFLKEGIKLQVHYIPVHLQPYYRQKFNYKKGDFPNAEKFYEQEISLPVYPSLTEEEVKKVISTVKKYIK